MPFSKRLLVIISTVLLAAGAAFGKCDTSSLAQRFDRADAVFLGQLVRAENRELMFRAIKTWKGVDEPRVSVTSEELLSGFQVGEVYLVYAHRYDGTSWCRGLYVGECSGTVPLLNAEGELHDLQFRAATSIMPQLPFGYGYGRLRGGIDRTIVMQALPQRSFWDIAVVTGISVMLSLSVGYIVTKAGRRFANSRRK